MADDAEIKALREEVKTWHADTNQRMETLNTRVSSILRQLPNEDSIQTTSACQEARNTLSRFLVGLVSALLALAGWVFWLTQKVR